MRMLFHNWTPPPIMITKEKLNTYPPLFSNNPLQWCSGLFAYARKPLSIRASVYQYFDLYIKILLRIYFMAIRITLLSITCEGIYVADTTSRIKHIFPGLPLLPFVDSVPKRCA